MMVAVGRTLRLRMMARRSLIATSASATDMARRPSEKPVSPALMPIEKMTASAMPPIARTTRASIREKPARRAVCMTAP
ncbi:hypothetical protein D3C80_1251720 [compost metagenome]